MLEMALQQHVTVMNVDFPRPDFCLAFYKKLNYVTMNSISITQMASDSNTLMKYYKSRN